MYDRTDFRYKYHGFAIIVKACALVCYAVAWYKTRHLNEVFTDKEEEVKNPDENEKMVGNEASV